MITFNEVVKDFGLEWGKHLKLNAQDWVIKFYNGSEIKLAELKYLPSDPEFNRLGSTAYTDGFIEEAAEITETGFEVLLSRLRWMLDIYDLEPSLLLTCNPDDGWLYKEFYKPFLEGKLDEDRAFVQAKVTDNPNPIFLEKYKRSLERIKDVKLKAKLLDGDWDYNSDANSLFTQSQIVDSFYKIFIGTNNKKYITCDVARFGSDDIVIIYWDDWRAEEIIEHQKLGTNETAQRIIDLANKYGVIRSHILVDQDGIGGGVVDQIPGCLSFVNNGRPIQTQTDKDALPEQYEHLKAQCFIYLSDNFDKLYLNTRNDPILQDKIAVELKAHKKVLNGKKINITEKKVVSRSIGRSPDRADAIAMRSYFDLIEKTSNVNMGVVKTLTKTNIRKF